MFLWLLHLIIKKVLFFSTHYDPNDLITAFYQQQLLMTSQQNSWNQATLCVFVSFLSSLFTFWTCTFRDHVHIAAPPEKSIRFSTGSAHVPVAFAFSAQVFFRVVFKGASSCFLSGYLAGPDKEVRLPAVSAFNQRAAFSMAGLTYTVKRLSQHWRSRLCVKRRSVRGGDWKINGFMFSSCLSLSVGSGTVVIRGRFVLKKTYIRLVTRAFYLCVKGVRGLLFSRLTATTSPEANLKKG